MRPAAGRLRRPARPLPVGNAYVRRAVASALVAHLERVDGEADAKTGIAHGVAADTHSDGEPWVLDAPFAGVRREVVSRVRP